MKTVAFQKLSVSDKTLWIGIGNSGRQDDGLGWAFLDKANHTELPGQKEYRYQLQIEDADLIRRFDQIIFVDATKEELPHGFVMHRIGQGEEVAFTTHALSPESVLALCRDVYGRMPKAWILAISGRKWNIGEGLSQVAEENLQTVLEIVTENVTL